MNAAITYWNGHPEVSIAKLSGVDSYVVAGSYNDGWYGRYTNYSHNGYFRIQLDSYSLSRASCTFYYCVRSTFSHEWGHVFNLAHNSLTSSIMRIGRNSNTYYNPNQHDRDDVSIYY